jgi:lysosomal acid phosphatase
MHTILTSLERIAFNGDPLQFLLIETTYQPFISFFHQTGITTDHPELQAIRTCGTTLDRRFLIQ